jgi:hypothetical protein
VVNPLSTGSVPAVSLGAAGQPLAHMPPDAERRGPAPSERFLVAVPAEPARAKQPLQAGYLRRPAQDARTFELTAAASRAIVTECLRKMQSRLVLSLGGRELVARVISTNGLDLMLALAGSGIKSAINKATSTSNAACTARVDLYDVPFLLRGQLMLSTTDRGDAAESHPPERHAVLSNLRIYTLDERRGTRVSLSRGQGTLRWARVVGGVPQVVQSSLLDLSPSGASIELKASDPELPIESFVGELQFGSVKIPLLAQLRRSVEAGEAGLAGLRLETGRGKRKLVDLYMLRRFPGLIPRADVSREKVAKLLGDSGYLKLREGEGPSAAWHRYRADHSVDVVYQAQDGKALGHTSITRSYKRTWLMHQLATISGHPESGLCRRALYDFGSSAPTAFDGEQAYALAYFNRKLRWHQLFFEQFAQWLNDDALGTVCAFDRFERSSEVASGVRTVAASAQASQQGGSYSIEPLREEDLLPAVALIRSFISPLVADALDVHPEDLQSVALNEDPQRTRTAFVLRGEQGLLGVALCETGPSCASLFNIFNLAQFYICSGSARPSVDAQLALLGTVRRFYRDKGTDSPLIVAPPGSFAADQEPGTSLAESMGCVAISGIGLRQFENYCRLQMGQLYQRKTPGRQYQGGSHEYVS